MPQHVRHASAWSPTTRRTALLTCSAGLKPAPRQVIEKREAREKKKKARKVGAGCCVWGAGLQQLLLLCLAHPPGPAPARPRRACPHLCPRTSPPAACLQQRKLTRVTNVHLAHLLEGEAPTNIETA